MDNTTIDDFIQIENDMILEYVRANPYPMYEEMLSRIRSNIELWSEYGKKQHICSKIIYENPTNKELIIQMGKKIYDIGGIQSLVSIHRILKYFSPYWSSKNHVIKSHGSLIEDYFQYVTTSWNA